MAWPGLSERDKALRAEFFELAKTLPKPPCSNGEYAIKAAMEEMNRRHGEGTLSITRAESWAKSLRPKKPGAKSEAGKHKKPDSGVRHYVRTMAGQRDRFVEDMEDAPETAPWANGPTRTEWGRLIDRSTFPMPRVEYAGRAL